MSETPNQPAAASVVVAPDELRRRVAAARPTDETGLPILSVETAERFRDMILTLPLVDPREATDSIVAAVLNATDLDGLNEPWESDKIETLLDHNIVIDTVKVLPSRYADGAGLFMRAEGVDERTGERVGFATSSWAIMAQLTAAHVQRMLPILCKPVRSDTPTTAGYFPQHLFVIATRYRTVTPDGAQS